MCASTGIAATHIEVSSKRLGWCCTVDQFSQSNCGHASLQPSSILSLIFNLQGITIHSALGVGVPRTHVDFGRMYERAARERVRGWEVRPRGDVC